MRISAIQINPELNNKDANLLKIKQYIDSTEADILIFPELATTGYFFLSRDETASLAESRNDKTWDMLQNEASKKNSIIIFGFIEIADDKIYNSAAILFPNESLSTIYRKTHLFYKERFCFDEGDTGFFVVEDKSRNINIGPMICYDWRFPEAARTLGLKGADLIVCPSCLVTNVWHIAMPARALENKTYLAVANRIGSEMRDSEILKFNGESAIYGYNGKIIARADGIHETVIYADIEPVKTRQKSFNEFNNIDNDRRPELYFR